MAWLLFEHLLVFGLLEFLVFFALHFGDTIGLLALLLLKLLGGAGLGLLLLGEKLCEQFVRFIQNLTKNLLAINVFLLTDH